MALTRWRPISSSSGLEEWKRPPPFVGCGPDGEPELAIELLRAAHGHGYATEAGRAVVTWVSNAGYQRLWATDWDWNTASRRVLAKLGFRETGRVEPGVHGDSLVTVREF